MLPEQPRDLIGVFGTPATLTSWGIHIVRTLVGIVRGHYEFVHGNYLADFAGVQGDRGSGGPVICVSDCPEFEVCKTFVESGAPIFVFVEEPTDVIGDMVGASGIDSVAALRLATRSLCAIQPLLEAPDAVVLRRDCLDLDVRDVMATVLAALRLAPNEAQQADIDGLLSLPAKGAALTCRDHIIQHFPQWAERQGSEARVSESAAVQAIAGPYSGLVTGLAMDKTEWPASIFSSGDKIGDYVDGPNELIGPARILVYGPYLHLTRGAWSAYVELEVSGNESGNQLKVDLVCGPNILASIIADLPVIGRYCFSMPFAIHEPLEPIELRFQIESGAIEGRFLLSKVVMTRQTAASVDTLHLAAG